MFICLIISIPLDKGRSQFAHVVAAITHFMAIASRLYIYITTMNHDNAEVQHIKTKLDYKSVPEVSLQAPHVY